jgi:hypothetical protein
VILAILIPPTADRPESTHHLHAVIIRAWRRSRRAAVARLRRIAAEDAELDDGTIEDDGLTRTA